MATETSTTARDDQAMQALSTAGAQCGSCGDEPGDRRCPDCERCYKRYVKALRAAGWAPRAEVLREAADEINDLPQDYECDPGRGDAAELLRRKANEAGPDRIVAYRNSHRPGVLLCREHGDGWMGLTPLTSDDLPDGGTCTYGDPADPTDQCGRDVLIQAAP